MTLLKKEKNQQLAEVGDGRLYDSMSQGRLDVYRYRAGGKRKDEYRVVLQRMINLMQGELSNRVFVKGTPLGEGPELDGCYEFLFSLYPDNLVEFRKTNKDDLLIGYYRGFHINKGSLIVSAYEDGVRMLRDFGIVKAAQFTKVQVDLLGIVSR